MAANSKAGHKLCPSARCAPGSLLLGVVQSTGTVDFLAAPLAVTERFSELAHQGRMPEARFRFSAPCLRSACTKWQGGCGVAERASALALQHDLQADPGSIPDCAIRTRCQWHAEHGAEICGACRWVITERATTADG